ncbi:MAG: hypothetical protein QNJ12_10740 [Ilumatobacter sp.]|uniref:hypothetical protein n=1 Tax=Ilumatobacter sp. TaxID=1967498 RepID=UPI00261A504A|nr:hypothetical protein [Ilumatobacter sp.]MDJ0769265.1 hypothetical protein [Ilumatobacter sp.]
MGTPFKVVQGRLDESALNLFDRMAQLHLAAVSGATQEFIWMRTRTMAGDGQQLLWLGDGNRGRTQVEFTGNDLQDLIDASLVRRARNSDRNNYRIPSDGVRFYRWRMVQSGGSSIEQVESAVRSSLEDPAQLALRHPEASRHLSSAFDKLWTESRDDNTMIEIGGSLRSAITAMTADLVGHDTSPEKVVTALEPWLKEPNRLPPRQPELLTSLLDWTVRCCQRIHHLHDERARGAPDPDWSELRRTAFLTSLLCYELDRLTPD